LDDGRLTDGQGRAVDFKNTVIIMTSNIGSQYITDLAGKSDDKSLKEMENRVMDALRAHFRPEFLNRVDDIILFHSLAEKQIERIVDIQTAHLQKLLAERKITLHLSEKAKHFLAKQGYDPVYGARPLKRAIQKYLQDPLSMQILEGHFKEGDSVTADAADIGGLTFKKG
jgi:ATP-dependent Clp protease ATP-binding subunit ClpB